MNVSEEFAELRKQFQRLHTELDQNMLFLDVCHWPDDKSQTESATEHCKVPIVLLGLVNIPIVHPKSHPFLFEDSPLALFSEFAAAHIEKQNRNQSQYYVVGFPEADQRPPRRLKVAYLRCPDKTTRQVAHQFRSLAQQAGAALPPTVSDVLPTSYDPKSYIDMWLEFIFWQHPPCLDDLLHLNSTLNTHLFRKPCDVSARAIAECGLNTANPAFRPRSGIWPVWAGFPPGGQQPTATPGDTETKTDTKDSGASSRWIIHEETDEPPAKFRRDEKPTGDPIGPLTGSKEGLGYALRSKAAKKRQLSLHFNQQTVNGHIWARKSSTVPRQFDCFMTSYEKLHVAEKRLKTFHTAQSSAAKRNDAQ